MPKTISVALDYSRRPVGCTRAHGPFSAERFREELLLPTMRAHSSVVVNLNGTVGYSSAWLKAAFHDLAGLALIARLTIRATDSSLAKEAWNYTGLPLGETGGPQTGTETTARLKPELHPCEHRNLREWDCGCAFGCETCHFSFECQDCRRLLVSAHPAVWRWREAGRPGAATPAPPAGQDRARKTGWLARLARALRLGRHPKRKR